MQSAAATPAEYLADLPDDRRDDVVAVLDVVRGALRPGFEETMSFGMIGWVVPQTTYPDTYNGAPLSYAALAMQKRHNALYLMCLYADPETEQDFRARWAAGWRRLDMVRSCLRYRRAADLDLDLVAEAVVRLCNDVQDQGRARHADVATFFVDVGGASAEEIAAVEERFRPTIAEVRSLDGAAAVPEAFRSRTARRAAGSRQLTGAGRR